MMSSEGRNVTSPSRMSPSTRAASSSVYCCLRPVTFHQICRDGGKVFPDRTYAWPGCIVVLADERRLGQWQRAAQAARVPLIAAGDVHYHDPNPVSPRCAVGHSLKTTVAELGVARFPNGERRLRPLTT